MRLRSKYDPATIALWATYMGVSIFIQILGWISLYRGAAALALVMFIIAAVPSLLAVRLALETEDKA